jgi:hypothetical protein
MAEQAGQQANGIKRGHSDQRDSLPSLPRPLSTQGGIALSDSEKAETLADNMETQFPPVTDPSVPAVTEMVDVALRS